MRNIAHATSHALRMGAWASWYWRHAVTTPAAGAVLDATRDPARPSQLSTVTLWVTRKMAKFRARLEREAAQAP